MILPGFGIISQVIPAFSRKTPVRLFLDGGRDRSIAILSFIVWAHQCSPSALPTAGILFFMYAPC